MTTLSDFGVEQVALDWLTNVGSRVTPGDNWATGQPQGLSLRGGCQEIQEDKWRSMMEG